MPLWQYLIFPPERRGRLMALFSSCYSFKTQTGLWSTWHTAGKVSQEILGSQTLFRPKVKAEVSNMIDVWQLLQFDVY